MRMLCLSAGLRRPASIVASARAAAFRRVALAAAGTSTAPPSDTLEKLRDQHAGVLSDASKRAQEIFLTRSATERPQEAMVAAIGSSKYRIYQKARREKKPMPLGNCGDLDYITKRPQDSLLRVLLPFASDPALKSNYVNFRGQIRVGKLLEDLDAFAGAVAYLHCDDGKEDVEPPILVTVSTDQISLLTYPLEADCDMMLVGMVSAVGSSSMSIDIDLVALPNATRAEHKPVLQAAFSFVARNSSNKPVAVPKLKPVSEFEMRMNKEGLKGMEERKLARKSSLLKQPPTSQELALVHDLFLEAQRINHDHNGHGLAKTANGVIGWMDDYKSYSTVLTMPQERNVHNRIFGGFLMRSAFELAFSHGWKTTGVLPKFLSLDATDFLFPVEIGQLLTFEASTTFSPGPSSKTFCVEVTAKMLNPAKGGGLTSRVNAGDGACTVSPDGIITNTFAFTFYSDDPSKTPRLMPRSYADAMRLLEAQRRVAYGARLADERKAAGAANIRFPLLKEPANGIGGQK